jgi:hypothetical protein
MNLGQHIVDSVVEAGAIERMIEDKDGGSMIFVWSSNANEQVEAAFLKRMKTEIREFSRSPSVQREYVVGLESLSRQGVPPGAAAMIMLATTLNEFFKSNLSPK